jgi:hypothetical protein
MKLEELKTDRFKNMTPEQVLEYASGKAREAIVILQELEKKENNGKALPRPARIIAKNQ